MDDIAITPEFRLHIIALLLYSDWLARYGVIILPDYFPLDDEKSVVQWVNDYYDAYRDVPSDVDIEEGLFDSPLLDKLSDISVDDLNYAADKALEFAQLQAMKIAILASVDDVKVGKLGDVRGRIEDALSVGVDMYDLGWDLVEDIDEWLYDSLHGQRHPTGWPAVDSVLGGGLVGGEYGLIMAPTGRGKSTALVNIGYALAGLLGATNVLHVTYEMRKQKVLRRYATRVSGMALSRGEYVDGYRSQFIRRVKSKLRAHLRVADPDRNVDALYILIDNLATQDFEVGALIVDYADLMMPSRHRRELRFELADITRDLRHLGGYYDIPVWSATQAGRQALYKEVITVSDVAEAIEKVNIADVVIALCQTRDEEELGRGRLFLAKVRDAVSGLIIPVKMDFALQSITQRRALDV